MTYDRRTGKPIASTVTKIAPEVVLSEARVTGVVTTEVKGEGSGDNTGRISYENRGECFFLPYTKDDVEGNVTLRTGDAVSFQIATNQRFVLKDLFLLLRSYEICKFIYLFQFQIFLY